MKLIALLGEFTPTFEPHPATDAAIEHLRPTLRAEVEGRWVSTEEVDEAMFERFAGLWVAPGSPYKNLDKALWAIRYARENRIPCLGTCGGFQHQILEYARNVLGFRGAQHAEYDPSAPDLFISRLACSLAGREMQLTFVPGSRVARIYGATSATERYYCNFAVNPDRVSLLEDGPLMVSGADGEGVIRVVELPDHPFFIGTLFVPQARSKPDAPHPLVEAFLTAVANGAVPVA